MNRELAAQRRAREARASALLVFVVVTLVLLVTLCFGCYEQPCFDGHYSNLTHYAVTPTGSTPGSIPLDGDLDGNKVYALSTKVLTCLHNKYPDGKLPPEVVAAGHCLRPTFSLCGVFSRECENGLIVKLAPDWHPACYSDDEVFPCSVDPKLCTDKGLPSDPACPCSCRATIQDNHVIVTTPNLKLYSAELIRLVTGCNYIWVEGLEECYAP